MNGNKATDHSIHKAFSIIELLVVIVIMGLLTAAGAPSFLEILRNQEASSTAQRLEGAIRLARIKAGDLGDYTSICGIANTAAETFNGVCSATSPWKSWMVFFDVGGDGVDTSAAGDYAIRYYVDVPSSVSVTVAPNTAVVYTGTGFAKSGTANRTFDVTPTPCARYKWQVIVETSGVTRTVRLNCP